MLLWVLVFSLPAHAQPPVWKLAKDSDGIQVYIRRMEDTGYRQLKAEAFLDRNLEGCVRLIRDAKAGTEWIHRMIVFEDLGAVNDTTWYTYGEITIPWPFQNKDLISRNTLSRNRSTGAVDITLESMPTHLPEKEGIKRIRQSEGKWRFEPQSSQKTKVIYTVYAEQDDFLPDWLVSRVVVASIHKTISQMQVQVSKVPLK
jgi:hypothetical protein